MENATNTVNNNLAKSSIDDEVKKLVEGLAAKIKEIAPKTDTAKVQKLGKNLERLSEEMAQPEPDRAWYELSLKGLKDAATAIRAIVTPVVAIVTKLATLLVP